MTMIILPPATKVPPCVTHPLGNRGLSGRIRQLGEPSLVDHGKHSTVRMPQIQNVGSIPSSLADPVEITSHLDHIEETRPGMCLAHKTMLWLCSHRNMSTTIR